MKANSLGGPFVKAAVGAIASAGLDFDPDGVWA
jgi:hypothetical protein